MNIPARRSTKTFGKRPKRKPDRLNRRAPGALSDRRESPLHAFIKKRSSQCLSRPATKDTALPAASAAILARTRLIGDSQYLIAYKRIKNSIFPLNVTRLSHFSNSGEPVSCRCLTSFENRMTSTNSHDGISSPKC